MAESWPWDSKTEVEKKKEKRKKVLELVSSLQTRHKNHLEVFHITCTDI